MDAPLPEVADRRLPSLSPHRRLPSLLPPLCCIGRRRPTPATHTRPLLRSPAARSARWEQRSPRPAIRRNVPIASCIGPPLQLPKLEKPTPEEVERRPPRAAPLQLLCCVPPRIPPSRHLSCPPTTRHTLVPPVSAGEQMARRLPRRASGPLRQAQGRVRQARRQAGDLVNCADAPVRHGSSSQT